ncbi:MAG: hypothetical protein ABEJ30_07195 [Halorientalis sp.]
MFNALGSVPTPDLVLSFIPGPLLVAVLVAFLLGVPLTLAVAAGSVPSMAAMAYALFYRPPIET